MCEKCKSTLLGTIHRCPEISELGMPFVHKRWRKRPYAFYVSCRAMQDLQLWYSNVGPLQFNFAPRPCRARTLRPASVRWSMRRGLPLPNRHSGPILLHHASRTHGQAVPTAPPSLCRCRRTVAMPLPIPRPTALERKKTSPPP
jgi:hypothetical protein